MYKDMLKNGKMRLVSLLGAIAIVFFVLWGCGGGTSSYDAVNYDPVLTKTANALVDATTLKGWMDQGLVQGVSSPFVTGEKVVILDYKDATAYASGHIPGAVRVDGSELLLTRLEGVAEMGSLVTDGPHMDAIIQRAGIDANTTIVFTSSSVSNATRSYATFRYWGFPKSRLKVLDGVDTVWKTANPMSLATPTIKPSSYCVTPNGVNRVQTQLRASLGEMMHAVQNYDGTKHTIIDDLSNPANGLAVPVTSTSTWSGNIYKGIPGSTSGLLPYAVSATTEYVVFEGHMKNAVNLYATNMYAGNVFFPADDGTPASLKSKFNAVGMDETKTAYIYCRAGNFATIEFFALDGILNWNVVWYDGSWGQWALMADKKGGKLKAGSIWSTYPLSISDPVPNTTDTVLPKYVRDAVDGVTYNTDNTPVGSAVKYPIQPLPYYINLDVFTSVTDPAANQIEATDKAYKSPLSSPSGGSSGGSSGGGC
ncbi:MAG: selenite/tellurite reduction operon rhodanese-like protein ExtH [Syntrophales bacterium]